ncbi:hypothetical protein [Anaerosporobacter faecicola]|uniref:hypothetical protein n=1 Tax=Anaerosporobacter faecicola TaxID=2718714 RepID=UPI0014392AAC|nr:hypothetical protein [Anaerosporobacter faecicola]
MKRKQNTLGVLMILIVAISLCGCEKSSKNEEVEEIVTMTEEQKNLLMTLCLDDEAISKGELTDWQIEILHQFDYAKEYLGRKYPSHTFTIVDGLQKNYTQSYTSFLFYDENRDELYNMRIDIEEKEEGNVYTAKDDYYGALLKEKYEQELMKTIQQVCDTCLAVNSNVGTISGEEDDETIDVKDMVEGKINIENVTTIFLDGRGIEDCQAMVDEVKQFIIENGIYGEYHIIALNDVLDEEESEDGYMDFLGQLYLKNENVIQADLEFIQDNKEGEK